jgi:hypothetical protein
VTDSRVENFAHERMAGYLTSHAIISNYEKWNTDDHDLNGTKS